MRRISIHQRNEILNAAEVPDFYARKFMEAYNRSCKSIINQYVDLEHNINTRTARELPEYKEKCEQLWHTVLRDKEANIVMFALIILNLLEN